MNIYFVRHFKTQGNLEKRYIGRTDEPLADIADQNLVQTLPQNSLQTLPQNSLQTLLQNLPQTPDLIVTSPMLRCLQTKALLYPTQAHIVQDDLREMDFGAFEMRTYDDLKDNTHYRNFIDGTEDALQGEATTAFKARCVNAFAQLIAETQISANPAATDTPAHNTTSCTPHAHAQAPANNLQPSKPIQNIVIVCHGGTIMSILEAYAAAPKRSYYDYQIANGAVLACNWNGQSLTILPETI